jgi:hypothetical protein
MEIDAVVRLESKRSWILRHVAFRWAAAMRERSSVGRFAIEGEQAF